MSRDDVDADLVERLTGRFDADPGVDRGHTVLAQCHRVGQRLGHGLDGEGLGGVPMRVHVSVVDAQRQSEALGIDDGQFRDVVGDVARPVAPDFVHDVAQVAVDKGFHGAI